ncbi:MAG: ArsC/Spx/MgsR family protein [Paracoccaceae bacterium]|nr:ArsC/Spx/MgsR family protein [Paracoccaceae bacterium]
MIIFGLKNCDTCRKALKSLPQAELVDVRLDGIPDSVLTAALETFGDAVINTRSKTWRGLEEHERNLPAIDLLRLHPAVMKRPLIATEASLYLGWHRETQQELVVT